MKLGIRSANLTDLHKLSELRALEGLFRVSDLDYHSGPGFSASQIVHMQRSPAHFKAALDKPSETSSAMKFGTAAHLAVLQPELFDSAYIVEPRFDGPKNMNPWKKEWDQFKADAAGREILSLGEFNAIAGIKNAIAEHTTANSLLTHWNTHCELAAYNTEAEKMIVKKAKADIVIPEAGIIADLKTTHDASPEEFSKTIVKYHYHVKAAWYQKIFNKILPAKYKITTFIWIAVEKEQPFTVNVFAASAQMMLEGEKIAEQIEQKIVASIFDNHWPQALSNEEVYNIELPGWYKA